MRATLPERWRACELVHPLAYTGTWRVVRSRIPELELPAQGPGLALALERSKAASRNGTTVLLWRCGRNGVTFFRNKGPTRESPNARPALSWTMLAGRAPQTGTPMDRCGEARAQELK
jgi:hypothetical protein